MKDVAAYYKKVLIYEKKSENKTSIRQQTERDIKDSKKERV